MSGGSAQADAGADGQAGNSPGVLSADDAHAPEQEPRGIVGAPALAHTGPRQTGAAAALSAALIGGGALMVRRTRHPKV